MFYLIMAFINQIQGIQPGSNLPQINANQSELQTILQYFFGIVGALALLFVVIGGFRYIISAGDPQAAAAGRKTILYAVIGLIVALSGEAIVTWVLGQI
jgi:hypothetical protein